MARRSTPERLDEARNAATRYRLMGEGMTEATANALLAAWADQAAREGIERGAGYWDAGRDWIAEQRARRVRS